MPNRLYLETTIPSYLAYRPSRDLLQTARQQLTREWWDNHRNRYDLCISRIVLDESSDGDPDAARRRLAYLTDIPLLDLTLDVDSLATAIVQSKLLPPRAARDAIHIAVASVHAVDFLLTWNCRHIANATINRGLDEIVSDCGFRLPVLCTPQELLGE